MASNRQYYNAIAGYYDTWHVEVGSAKIVDEVNRRRLVAIANGRRFHRALDLGCGSGRVLPWLDDLAEFRTGLDLSIELLNLARQRDAGARLVGGEVGYLPFPDASFDLVVVNGALHHFFDLSRVVSEVSRILQPGGLFAALGEPRAGWERVDNPFFVLWTALSAIGRPILRTWRRGQHHEVADDLCQEPDAEAIAPTELEACCRAVGLNTLELTTYDFFPRRSSSHPIYLRLYRIQLGLEQTLFKHRFRLCGQALQYFGIKQMRNESA